MRRSTFWATIATLLFGFTFFNTIVVFTVLRDHPNFWQFVLNSLLGFLAALLVWSERENF